MTKEQKRRENRKKGYAQTQTGGFVYPKGAPYYDTPFKKEKRKGIGCDYTKIP